MPKGSSRSGSGTLKRLRQGEKSKAPYNSSTTMERYGYHTKPDGSPAEGPAGDKRRKDKAKDELGKKLRSMYDKSKHN